MISHSTIPTGWKEAKIGELGTMLSGGTPSTNNPGYWNGDIPWISSSDLIDGDIKHIDIKRHISQDAVLNSATKIIPPSSILVVSRVGVGKLAVNLEPICTSQDYQSIVNDKSLFDSYYLAYLLSMELKKFLYRNQGTSIKGFLKKDLQEFSIKLPPLPEQNHIVAILETWDRAIEKLTKKIGIKKDIKKGLIQKLTTGIARLPGFDEKWKEVGLCDIGIFSKGAGISKSDLSDDGHNAVRYAELYTKHHYRVKEIFSYISDDTITSTKKIKYGDILFAGSGETIDEIGKSAAYLMNEPCYASGDTIIFSPKNSNSLFLSFLLNTGNARKKLREYGQGQSVVHIYKRDLQKLKLIIPPLLEQTAIANILTTADEEIEALEKKLAYLEDQKKYLLNNLVTGKIRVPEFTN